VLFFQESPDVWVAQALEHDIAAHGQSVEAAKLAFQRTVKGYLLLDAKHGREPLSSLSKAPSEFWEAWERARSATMPAEEMPSVPPAYMIPVISQDRPDACN
jgi:hypothetical protein